MAALERGQVWLDQRGGSREITYLQGKGLKYKFYHPQSALVKEMNSTVAEFLEKIEEFGYVLRSKEDEPAAWQEWPEEMPQLTWDDWEDEVSEGLEESEEVNWENW